MEIAAIRSSITPCNDACKPFAGLACHSEANQSIQRILNKKNNCINASFVPAHLNGSQSNTVSKRCFFPNVVYAVMLLMLTFPVIITTKLNITNIHSFLFNTEDVGQVWEALY